MRLPRGYSYRVPFVMSGIVALSAGACFNRGIYGESAIKGLTPTRAATTQRADPSDDVTSSLWMAEQRMPNGDVDYASMLDAADRRLRRHPEDRRAFEFRTHLQSESIWNDKIIASMESGRYQEALDMLRLQVGDTANFAQRIKQQMEEEPAAQRARAPSVSDAAMARLLDRKVPAIGLDAVELHDVVDFLRDISDAHICVDWKALRNAGIGRDAAVTVREAKDLSFRKLLDVIVVATTTKKTKVEYAIVDGLITISTHEDLIKNSPKRATQPAASRCGVEEASRGEHRAAK